MKRTISIGLVLFACAVGTACLAQCPEDTVDSGECDSLYVEPWSPDLNLDMKDGPPYFVRVPLLVTHDVPDPTLDSLIDFVVPLTFTHSNPAKYCSTSAYWNTTSMLYLFPDFDTRSIFRHLVNDLDPGDTVYHNRFATMAADFSGREWDTHVLDVSTGTDFWLAVIATGMTDQKWWEGSRVLLATITFKLEDTMTVCVDSTFWPPTARLGWTRMDSKTYVPRHNLPICFTADTAGGPGPEGVEVTAGPDQSGYADSTVLVTFLVQNVGVAPDSYSVNVSDTQGWDIVPLHYDLALDSAETDTVDFVVSIPYVPLGTADHVTLVAVSKTNPSVSDLATLTITCNAFKEGVDLTSGADQTGPTMSEVELTFYIENTGFETDTYNLDVTDPAGWLTSPLHHQMTLDPGESNWLELEAFIPNVPLETTARIRLDAVSQTNPYAGDSDSLTVTCDDYTINITGVADIPNDQGRQVRLKWLSFTDTDPSVNHFAIFRRIDSLLTSVLPEWTISRPFEVLDGLVYPPGEWEVVSTIPAYGETLYATVVPTLKDSTIAEGIYYSVFFLRAGTDDPYVYYDSPVDSGYSLDNLSPSPPTALVAFHQPAVTKLVWSPTTSSDFDYYTVYRDTLSEFTSHPGNRLAYTIDTTFIDSTAELGRTYCYLASATDFSGNESESSNEAMGIRYITGDANSDGVVNVGDVVHLVAYLYRNGSAPSPVEAGDVNCDGIVDVGDVVYLVNYLYKGGPPPCEPRP